MLVALAGHGGAVLMSYMSKQSASCRTSGLMGLGSMTNDLRRSPLCPWPPHPGRHKELPQCVHPGC